jgi:hypothetical protein
LKLFPDKKGSILLSHSHKTFLLISSSENVSLSPAEFLHHMVLPADCGLVDMALVQQ